MSVAQRPQKLFMDAFGADPYEAPHPVMFRPIEGVLADWGAMRKCREGLDVMWGSNAVQVMTEKGTMRRIYAPEPIPEEPPDAGQTYVPPPRNSVTDVAWDGEDFWITTSRRGVGIVAPSGKLRATVAAAQGLPPYSRLLTSVLGPGRALLAPYRGNARLRAKHEKGTAACRQA